MPYMGTCLKCNEQYKNGELSLITIEINKQNFNVFKCINCDTLLAVFEDNQMYPVHYDNYDIPFYITDMKGIIVLEDKLVKMKLKYFDDNNCELNITTECLWQTVSRDYLVNEKIWDLETIERVIISLQQYFSIREQECWPINQRKLRSALDDLGRVAYCLIKLHKCDCERTVEDERYYMTKKLLCVLGAIDDDLIDDAKQIRKFKTRK